MREQQVAGRALSGERRADPSQPHGGPSDARPRPQRADADEGQTSLFAHLPTPGVIPRRE